MSTQPAGTGPYSERIAREIDHYREVENVHDLPAIYHYWSAGHVDPLLRRLGWESLDAFFTGPLTALCRAKAGARIVSLGSGNGDLELHLARLLRDGGHATFTIRRLELNDAMRRRAREGAVAAGLDAHLVDEAADLNTWVPHEPVDAVIANHSLHHVVELEHLFEAVRAALCDDGVLIVNDMIGRNGHMRWPEALELVQAVWAVMPDRYRYNRQLQRHEERYENWDCSTEGFEGIRAQDVLPLLNRYFHAEAFLAYANVIDLFVDRGFGHNFDPERADDRAFIDAVARLDEAALALGVVKPTHLLAHYRNHPVACRYVEPFSPAYCVRDVPPQPAPPSGAAPPPAAATTGGSGAFGVAKRLADLFPPIRRLRRQRDDLAAQVHDLRRRLEETGGGTAT